MQLQVGKFMKQGKPEVIHPVVSQCNRYNWNGLRVKKHRPVEVCSLEMGHNHQFYSELEQKLPGQQRPLGEETKPAQFAKELIIQNRNLILGIRSYLLLVNQRFGVP